MIGCCEKWDSVHLHVGRINLPLMRVFVANWPRSPLARGQLAWQSLASNTWNVSSTNPARRRANLPAPCFPCFDQSVMMFVNRMVRPRGTGSQNVQKIAAAGESWWRWRLMVVLKLVRSYRLCSGDICDFYETFENISRFIAQIQSSFSRFFSTFPVLPSRSNAGRQWLCLPCL